MSGSRTIVGIGEALFDLHGDTEQMGGAPLNLAWHAQQLGNAGVLVSRVGQDRLGDAIFAALRERGMAVDHLQSDPDYPTGTIIAETSAGETTYEIVSDVAWDFLQWDGDMETLAAQAHGVCFSTLTQRVAQSRNTVFRFVDAAKRAVRLLDINARQPQLDRREIDKAMDLANALLVEKSELSGLCAMFLLPEAEHEAAAKLCHEHRLDWVAVKHDAGVTVYTTEGAHEAEPFVSSNVDASGVGPATAAALLHGAVRRWDWPRTIKLANALGAHVASQQGPRPEPTDAIKQLAD